MNLQTLGISICAIDGASNIFSKVTGSARRMGSVFKQLAIDGKRLGAVKELSGRAGTWATVAGAGLAGGLGFQRVIDEGANAEHQLRSIGNIAEWSGDRWAQVRRELLDHSVATNQSLGSLTQSLGDLLAKGMDEGKALKLLPTIGKAATAANAEVADLSNTLFSMVDVAGVPIEKAAKSLEGLVVSGKKGAFELKDMAKSLPSILATSSMLGMKGSKGVAQVGAWLQVARSGTGNGEEAATNFQNFLMKLISPETEQKFAKLGANLKNELAAARASGDLVGTMVRRTVEISKGDIGKLFQDQQVIKFLAAAMPKQGMAKNITSASMNSKGVIDHDFEEMMKSWNNQQQKFANLVTRDLLPKLEPWLRRLNGALTWLTANPKVLSAAITGVIALIGGGLTLKFMSFALGPAVTFGKGLFGIGKTAVTAGKDLAYCLKNAGSLREGLQIFSQLKLPGWLNTDVGAKLGKLSIVQKALTLGLWGSVKAIWAQTVALLANPITWVVVGVMALVGAAILLWKNWDKVTAWFKGAWVWFQGLWAKVPGWAKWLMPVIQIPMLIIKNWDRIKGWASALWGWLKQMFAKYYPILLFPLIGPVGFIIKHWGKIKTLFTGLWTYLKGIGSKFFEAGKNIAKSLWEGIKAMAMAPVNAVKGIVTKIRRFLPFSPAKEGPLSDIHKVGGGLLGTITSSLKPEGLLAKVGGIAGKMRQAFAGAAGVALTPGAGALRVIGAAAGAGAISLSITVHVQGGGAGVREDVRKAVLSCVPEIEKALSARQDRQQRGAFK